MFRARNLSFLGFFEIQPILSVFISSMHVNVHVFLLISDLNDYIFIIIFVPFSFLTFKLSLSMPSLSLKFEYTGSSSCICSLISLVLCMYPINNVCIYLVCI